MKKRFLATRGMTLLEMLLVIALLGLLASTVFVMLPRGGGESDVILATEQLRTELATMRSRARSGEERAAFGVDIATSSYTGFKVVAGATTTLLTTPLPLGITATEAVVTFAPISGASRPTTLTITGANATRTIEVTAAGTIQ